MPLRFHRALDAIGLILKWKQFYSLPFEAKYAVRFTEEDFLRAYGVLKNTTKRNKKEFSSRERTEALKVLHELDVTDVLIQIKSKKGDGHKVTSIVDTLIKYEKITEFTKANQKLHSYITIRLNPYVWIDSQPVHYISKPTNLQAILKGIPKKDRKTFDMFISIVICDHPKYPRNRRSINNKGLYVKKSLEGWALRLNLEHYLVNRKHNYVKTRLSKMASYGLKHGFLQLAEWTSDGKAEFLKVSIEKDKKTAV